jgi:hypothetical protein
MTPEEFVLIKWCVPGVAMYLAAMMAVCSFDSAEGVSVLTPHTAFLDPSMPEGSLPRESIELRALVFYD